MSRKCHGTQGSSPPSWHSLVKKSVPFYCILPGTKKKFLISSCQCLRTKAGLKTNQLYCSRWSSILYTLATIITVFIWNEFSLWSMGSSCLSLTFIRLIRHFLVAHSRKDEACTVVFQSVCVWSLFLSGFSCQVERGLVKNFPVTQS